MRFPGVLQARTTLPVTVAQRQWKEAVGKTAACRSIPAGIVVSIGLFILLLWSGCGSMVVDRRGSSTKRNFVGRRSALLSDFLKRTLLGNYFEFTNELRWALLAESFLPRNKLRLDGILSVGRQVRPPHSGPLIGAPVASLRGPCLPCKCPQCKTTILARKR